MKIKSIAHKKAQGFASTRLGIALLGLFLLVIAIFALVKYSGLNLLDYIPTYGNYTPSGIGNNGEPAPIEDPSSPEFTIAAVCNIIGWASTVEAYSTSKGAQAAETVAQAALAAADSAPEVLVQDGTQLVAKWDNGAEVLSAYKVKNINNIGYVLNLDGKIVGQVGNAAKIVPVSSVSGVPSTFIRDFSTKQMIPIAETTVGKGIADGALRIPASSKLIEATTGRVLPETVGDVGALFTKTGALKLVAKSSNYAVLLRTASHALNVLTVLSTLCDVSALSYTIYTANQASKQMAESGILADASLARTITAIHTTVDALKPQEEQLWADYNNQMQQKPLSEDLQISINKIHTNIQTIAVLDSELEDDYKEYSTNSEKGRGSAFSDREYNNLKSYITRLRSSIVSTEIELGTAQERLNLYIYSD